MLKIFKLSKDAILGNYVNAVTYGNLDSSINEAIGIGWVDGSVSVLNHTLLCNTKFHLIRRNRVIVIFKCNTRHQTGELGNLKQTTVPIRSNDSCSAVYDLQWNPDRMICAGNGVN